MGSVTIQSCFQESILVLYGAEREIGYFKKKLSNYAPLSDVFYVCSRPKDYDMMSVFEDCCKLIETFNISVIINRAEEGAPLHSALLSRFPEIPGPTFLATFLTLSKRYTREIIAEPLGLNVPFAVVMENSNVENFSQLLKPLPCKEKIIAKPIFSNGSFSLKVMASKEEALSCNFFDSLDTLKADKQYLWYRNILSVFLENSTYSFDQGYMVELYAEKDVATFHGVDCLIYKKTLLPWCIRDQLYWDRRKECHIGSAFPTTLSLAVQEKVGEVVQHLATQLIDLGYDHQFFEAELIVFKTGKIALMEINGRMPATMTSTAYSDVLQNGDPIETFVSMAEDKNIEAPSLTTDRHGLFAQMVTFGKGKVSDLVDIDKVKEHANIELNVDADAFIDGSNSPSGSIIGYVNCSANSRKNCLRQARDVITSVTKASEMSPWCMYGNDIQ